MTEEERIEIEWEHLPYRVENVLKLHGIQNIDQLVKLSTRELLQWRNFGKKSINDIRRYLAKYDLSLKDETVNPDVQKMILKDIPAILDKIRTQVEDSCRELRYLSFKLEQISTEARNLDKR